MMQQTPGILFLLYRITIYNKKAECDGFEGVPEIVRNPGLSPDVSLVSKQGSGIASRTFPGEGLLRRSSDLHG